jgi:pimeloyl-ACP methyl ester carboxylesterase
LETSGFVLTDETVADLAKIDLWAAVHKLPDTLVLSRDDLAGEARFAAHLVQGGARITLLDLPGYAAMMQDPHDSQIPETLFAGVIDWLSRRHERAAAKHRVRGLSRHATPRAELDGVKERALRLGTPSQLFGILTEPQAENARPSRQTGILLLNVGANHHIGPNRMWVTLARRLGRAGYRVFRFDVAGIGESPAAPGTQENRLYSEDSNADVQSVIDHLTLVEHFDRFVLVGLCSGAFLAFHTTLADPRVTGQVLINMPTFHWKEGDTLELAERRGFKSSRFYLRGLFQRQMWSRLASGEINVRGIAGSFVDRWVERAKDRLGSWLPNPPLVEGVDVLASFKQIAERGAESLLLYSSEDGGLDEIERHIGREGARLRSRPNFAFETIEGADHTFSPVVTREALFLAIQSHLEERFA